MVSRLLTLGLLLALLYGALRVAAFPRAPWSGLYQEGIVALTYPAAVAVSIADARDAHQLTMPDLLAGRTPITTWEDWTGPGFGVRYARLCLPTSRQRAWTEGTLLLLLGLLAIRFWRPLTRLGRRLHGLKLSRSSGSAGWGGFWVWWRLHVRRSELPFVLGRIGPFGLGPKLGVRERDQARNAILLGPPGYGKSRLIIENLLRLDKRYGRRLPSITVTDSKGSVHARTAGHLATIGYRVVHIDWINPQGSGYNPLDPCHLTETSDVFAWAQALIDNTGSSATMTSSDDQQFWRDTTTALLVAIVLTLGADNGKVTLHDLQQVLSLDHKKIKALIKHSNDPVARELGSGLLSHMEGNDRLESSVFTGPPLKLMALWDERIAKTSGQNSVDWKDLADPSLPPTAVFLTMPAGYEQTLRPFIATLFHQMNTELLRCASSQPGARKVLPRRIINWWDEAGTIGRITDLPARLNTTREAGIGTILGVQSTDQLTQLYGPEGCKIILQGCYVHVILAGLRGQQAESVASELGQATVAGQQGSANRQGHDLLFRDSSLGLAEKGRPLRTADEVRRVWSNQALVIMGNMRPVRVWWSGRWYLNPVLRRRGALTPPGAPPAPMTVAPLPASGPTSELLIDWSAADV